MSCAVVVDLLESLLVVQHVIRIIAIRGCCSFPLFASVAWN
jgi:hypothetical protein